MEHLGDKDALLEWLLKFILIYGATQLRSMTKSVKQLNHKIAQLLDHVNSHEKRITALEKAEPVFKSSSHRKVSKQRESFV